jgi:hypothetical protein
VGEVPETVGESRATLSKLIDAADAWRDKTDGDVRSMRGVDAPLETELVIEADPESFRYLASTAPVPWLRYLQTEMKMLIALYEIVQELEKLPLSGLQKLTQLADEITKAYQTAEAEARKIGILSHIRNDVIAYEEGAVLVRRAERFRIHCRSEELRDLITAGKIPPLGADEVRGLLHLARNGPRLLRSVEESNEVLTLVEALHKELQNVTITGAKARDDTSLFSSIAHLDILGPDDTELQVLARVWDRVRRKGVIHIDRHNDALLEVALHRAMVPRYSMDSSPTNRSSIQIRATGPDASVILTGDGRQETLMRGLEQIGKGACRVFKAAHHGSARNIRMQEMPNRMLSKLEPEQVWVSGAGDEHPSRDFLDYLRHQYAHTPFRLKVTNANAHVNALPPGTIPAETLTTEPLSIEF